jgi:hypothetical protein
MATTNWIRQNYYKVAAIGIGAATAVGLLYSLWSSKQTKAEDKVTSGKIAEFLAKKWMDKIEL